MVCLLGAESTGKTTIAQALAAQLSCPWVPEYLRRFCDSQQRTPRRDEQALILETQHIHALAARECAARQGAPFVFCDTAPLLSAIYSEDVFGDRSLLPRGRALHALYDLTLLCEADLGWVADGFVRDGPATQMRIHSALEAELSALAHRLGNQACTRISGSGGARIKAAVDALQRHHAAN